MKMFELYNEQQQEANCWKLGVLVMTEVDNHAPHSVLDRQKRELESELQKEYGQSTRQELKALHPIDSYVSYYKKFGYTYHVLPQLESVAHGKEIPSVSPLVEAMFMAELKNMLLTAGHDLGKIRGPLTFASCTGTEHYIGMNQKEVSTNPDDKMLSDEESVISSILKGQDRRTCIESGTRQVLYTVYAPQNIEDELILRHLKDIESYVQTFSGFAHAQLIRLY
jgi:DNA/RNA-binding domain of Phe-tRNA-synthetase-like protein